MPKVSRAFIKSGMLFFLLGGVLGVITKINVEWSVLLMPVFWHSITVGWITQIIMGVSLWMFPGRSKTEDFHSQFLSWVTYSALNAGLLLRVLFEPHMIQGEPFSGYMLALSALLQCVAAVTYVLEIWPRVQSKEKRLQLKRDSMRREDATD